MNKFNNQYKELRKHKNEEDEDFNDLSPKDQYFSYLDEEELRDLRKV